MQLFRSTISTPIGDMLALASDEGLCALEFTSGLSRPNKDQLPERGARMARRDDRAYREYVREEQRSQPGCPPRKMVLDRPRQATIVERPNRGQERFTRLNARL